MFIQGLDQILRDSHDNILHDQKDTVMAVYFSLLYFKLVQRCRLAKKESNLNLRAIKSPYEYGVLYMYTGIYCGHLRICEEVGSTKRASTMYTGLRVLVCELQRTMLYWSDKCENRKKCENY